MQVVITEEEFQKLHWVIAAKVADALNVIQVDCVNRDTGKKVGDVQSMLSVFIRDAIMKEMT